MVLDASALVAFLKAEPGGDTVAGALRQATISAVNFAEVVAHFAGRGMPIGEIDQMLDPLPLTIVPADHELARVAGQLRTATAPAGLSLGDRFCLALAAKEGVPALTADRVWVRIADAVGVEVVTIR